MGRGRESSAWHTDRLCHSGPLLPLQHHDAAREKLSQTSPIGCANRMQIYIKKCPKIELRNRIAVRIRSVCSWSDFEGDREVKSSKFKMIYPALVLTLWRELSYLAISITFHL